MECFQNLINQYKFHNEIINRNQFKGQNLFLLIHNMFMHSAFIRQVKCSKYKDRFKIKDKIHFTDDESAMLLKCVMN